MTTDAAFKKQVRELAEREGIPYAEARTRLMRLAGAFLDQAEAVGTATAAEAPDDGLLAIRFVVQQTIADPMVPRPYPWLLDEEGKIGQQSLWRGDPIQVIAFQRGDVQVPVAYWEDFVADPQSVIGLVPVMTSSTGGFAAWRGEITSVQVREDDSFRA